MKLIMKAYLTILLFIPSIQTYADMKIFSGNSWMVYCEEYPNDEERNGLCEIYTRGVIEGLLWGYTEGSFRHINKIEDPFCQSENHTIGQYIYTIRRFLINNPEKLNKPASMLIYYAMKENYPCN